MRGWRSDGVDWTKARSPAWVFERPSLDMSVGKMGARKLVYVSLRKWARETVST
jgi:hypothetical protein